MNAKIDSDHTKLIFDYMRIDGKVETLLEFLLSCRMMVLHLQTQQTG